MSTLLRAVAVSCCLLPAVPAPAQSFPAKPLRMIVPFAAGGPTDITARLVAPRMTELLGGQPIIIVEHQRLARRATSQLA
jgi:tripartite-type tricarboxylate transporter receptor subunit TctC